VPHGVTMSICGFVLPIGIEADEEEVRLVHLEVEDDALSRLQ